VARIAPHYRIALVIGERGVGKRVIAQELHKRSAVAQLPFEAMRVAEFTESEAVPVERGTVYLHGLETSHPALQEPLLRRLKVMAREVRVVFGSECDLKGMVAAGRLRADVYDAIAMLEIRIVPLRERLDDLEGLANSLLRRDGRDVWFAPSAIAVMSRHMWPGNLEELARMCDALGAIEGAVDAHVLPPLEGTPVRTAVRLDEVMQKHVMDVLQRCAGNKLKAAELLGISRSTLYRMLETAMV
jgi:DNA-binding NtrC family response regulator